MEDIHIPDKDTFIECNELLQDLSVNYRKEGLYTAFLQPVLRGRPQEGGAEKRAL